MVLVYGVDIPLVELVIGFSILLFIMLMELVVFMIILMYQIRENKILSIKLRNAIEIFRELKDKELELRKLKK